MFNQMDNFDEIIGSGGYGLIVGDKKLVAKLLYKRKDCSTSKEEYEKQTDIYNTIKAYREDDKICVSKPLAYSMESIEKFNMQFSCFFLMKRLNNLNQVLGTDDGLYHIVNDEYSHMNKKIGRVYNQPISEENPSRGFFATYSYIQENILNKLPRKYLGKLSTIDDILELMGYSFALMTFIAEYYPVDVEYLLGLNSKNKLCFMILDFGMFEKINFGCSSPSESKEHNQECIKNIVSRLQEIIDIEIYYPIEKENFLPFIKGMNRVKKYLSGTKLKIYKEFLAGIKKNL